MISKNSTNKQLCVWLIETWKDMAINIQMESKSNNYSCMTLTIYAISEIDELDLFPIQKMFLYRLTALYSALSSENGGVDYQALIDWSVSAEVNFEDELTTILNFNIPF